MSEVDVNISWDAWVVDTGGEAAGVDMNISPEWTPAWSENTKTETTKTDVGENGNQVNQDQNQVPDQTPDADQKTNTEENWNTKLDIEWLREFAAKQRQAKQEEEASAQEEKEEEKEVSQPTTYSAAVRARIRQIHNWVVSEYGTAPITWKIKKENETGDDVYIKEWWKALDDSWKIITPERYKEMALKNLTLAKFVAEQETVINEHKEMKTIIETMEEKQKFYDDMPKETFEFVNTMQKASSWDAEAQMLFIEMIWVEFDKILPWMGWKYYQFLNSFHQTPSSNSSEIQKKKKMSRKSLIDQATSSLFD